ncbi:uncharacterized protein LOC131166811 [Malania oleifera]|uniref:uncharacterized protein LOC131166811 n=1 Tax=Malania oleifera TaxID=397392 RepID=UPI0025ADB5E1|nr:uncharacterized protein LOC131166811 [Malania oleifera]
MNKQILYPQKLSFQFQTGISPEHDIPAAFFKCIRWQLEETMDTINCPYHYFCDTTYPAENYPPSMDLLVLIFTAATYMATLVFTVNRISQGRNPTSCTLTQSRRYLLPSGPVFLPAILIALARGHSINTMFPLPLIGPAILQLIHISALAFEHEARNDTAMKFALFEASTISGILHASLYLDSIILPYYTGLDALMLSAFSGECASCVCRKEALVVGGKLVRYRGTSVTTFAVVGTLGLRIFCRVVSAETRWKTVVIGSVLEGSSWVFVTLDSVYLIRNSPSGRSVPHVAAFGGVFVLICLHVLNKVCIRLVNSHIACEKW